jgi:hypothetical protein
MRAEADKQAWLTTRPDYATDGACVPASFRHSQSATASDGVSNRSYSFLIAFRFAVLAWAQKFVSESFYSTWTPSQTMSHTILRAEYERDVTRSGVGGLLQHRARPARSERRERAHHAGEHRPIRDRAWRDHRVLLRPSFTVNSFAPTVGSAPYRDRREDCAFPERDGRRQGSTGARARRIREGGEGGCEDHLRHRLGRGRYPTSAARGSCTALGTWLSRIISEPPT